MAAISEFVSQKTWTAVALLCALGGIFLALGAGLVTGERVGYVSTLGAFAICVAGTIIMWHSERTAAG